MLVGGRYRIRSQITHSGAWRCDNIIRRLTEITLQISWLQSIALSAIERMRQSMALYKTRWFARWARKERLGDQAICEAVEEMSAGLYETDLGGNLFKKRIARQGQGKRGGFRTVVATNLKGRWFFVYGFAKNERDNIEKDEEAALKELAAKLLTMPPQALAKAVEAGELIEVNCDA